MPTGHRFPATDLHQFVVSLFTHLRQYPRGSHLVADHLIAANLAGHDSHGVGMIPTTSNPTPVVFCSSTAPRHGDQRRRRRGHPLDGNAGFGPVVAHEAMQLGIEKAKQHEYGGYRPAQCASRRIASATGPNGAPPPG